MNITFKQIHDNRKFLIKNNATIDHVLIKNQKSNICISAPHGVSQTRNNKIKVAEPGSLATALFLSTECSTNFIAKTKNNNDDANFDEESSYKNDIKNLLINNDIKYLLDFHGLSKFRNIDINLGTNHLNNIVSDIKIYKELKDALITNGFIVEIDYPFKAGGNTISSFAKNIREAVFSIQIEINSDITNNIKNFKKYQLLLTILKDWINNLEK